MRDKFLDFVENHRKLTIFIIVLVLLLGVVLALRAINSNKTVNEPPVTSAPVPTSANVGLEQDKVDEKKPESPYQSSLGIGLDDGKVDRVDVPSPTVSPDIVIPVQKQPTFTPELKVWGWTSVPKRNQDGSSCDAYLKSVTLSDFGTMWGSDLTEDDFLTKTRQLIGVEQNPDDSVLGSLQSVGWLIQNLDKLDDDIAIKFTNLHVIGSLSDKHTAVLCSYDWYSAFGLNDTLVVFEDISGTIDEGTLKAGDMFSALVFKHNIKVTSVNGQNVVVVQYNVFETDTDEK